MLHTELNFDRSTIRFDGVYTLYDMKLTTDNSKKTAYDIYFLDNFFVFYKNGMVVKSAYVFYDSLGSSDYLKNFMVNENREEAGQEGVFNIINKDNINIICYDRYGINNGYVDNFITHYKGTIKNADTIIDLRIVEPYPDVKPLTSKLMRTKYFKRINERRMLIFKPFPAKKLVDSNNFWINVYKQ